MNNENYRKCVACGDIKPRKDMLKITKEYSSEEVVIQPDSKTFGRSVYLCYNRSCIENAFKKNKINRVLKINSHLEKEHLFSFLQD